MRHENQVIRDAYIVYVLRCSLIFSSASNVPFFLLFFTVKETPSQMGRGVEGSRWKLWESDIVARVYLESIFLRASPQPPFNATSSAVYFSLWSVSLNIESTLKSFLLLCIASLTSGWSKRVEFIILNAKIIEL